MSELVHVVNDAKERVALDLMRVVMQYETVQVTDRTYILKLYSQCLSMVRGSSTEAAMERRG